MMWENNIKMDIRNDYVLLCVYSKEEEKGIEISVLIYSWTLQ